MGAVAARADFIAALAALLGVANADHVRIALQHAASADHGGAIVLDCETIPFVDVTAARMLSQVTADLRRQGIRLVVARDIGRVRDMLTLTGGDAAPEYFPSVQDAVNAVRPAPSALPGKEG